MRPWILSFILSLTALPALAHPAYVDPRIAVHARQKLQQRHNPRWLSWRGLQQDGGKEQVAVYVTEHVDHKTEQLWAAHGIALDPDTWIPPVLGHHPLGYHIAKVPYAQVAWLANQPSVRRLAPLEIGTHRHNDLVRAMLKADLVQAGTNVKATSGEGVKLCIADSSLDTTHLDIPKPTEAYDVTTGNSVSKWQTDVTSHVTEHGTHVTGIAVGNGHWSGGKYRGVAPGALLHFYKIADNTTGSSSDADEVRAIQRAVKVGCHIFSMSYGELGTALDGADATEQAVDAANAQNMLAFISAGNEADGGVHTSVTVQPGASVQVKVTLDNTQGTTDITDPVNLTAAWRDATPGDDNIGVSIKGLHAAETWTDDAHWTSERNTDYHAWEVAPSVTAGATREWLLTVSNKAVGSPATVHLFIDDVNVDTFFTGGGDPAYTVNSPAVADTAIAVGAVVQRRVWTDWLGDPQDDGPAYLIGKIATFSSRGPRIDDVRKPDLLAPGSMTISVRDSQIALDDTTLVDDDGVNLDGKQTAHYLAEDGTSMACPAAAASAALLASAVPTLSAAAILQYLDQTAAHATAPDNDGGFGLIDVEAAIAKATCEVTGDCSKPAADAGSTDAEEPADAAVLDDTAVAAAGTDAVSADVVAEVAAPSSASGSVRSGCTAGTGAPAGLASVLLAAACLAARRRNV
jgi:subtilisin family serine protease